MRILLKKNYLAMIGNSVKGENWMFRNFHMEIDGKETDILKNGGLSCAVFASAILYLNQFIKEPHANTYSVEKDMLANDWFEIKDFRKGAVLIWEKRIASDDGMPNPHIGFFWEGEEAISNDSRGTGFPHKHHYTYNDTRKIEKIYWHPSLDER